MTLNRMTLGKRLARHGKGDINAMYDKIITLQAEVARLTMQDAARVRQLTEAHAEARHLRQELQLGSRMPKIILRAEIDSLEMIKLYMLGIPTVQSNVATHLLISKRRWYWGKALSKLAGIHGRWEYELLTENRDGQPMFDLVHATTRLHDKADFIITHKRWDDIRDLVPA